MSIWKQIKSDFFNEEEQRIYIDAWLTSDDNEEGKTIAKIDINHQVEYLDECAKTDAYAQEVINDAICDDFARKAYNYYCLDYSQDNPGVVFESEEKLNFDDFKTDIFRSEECMKYLLNDDDFKLWLEILEQEEIIFQKKTFGGT